MVESEDLSELKRTLFLLDVPVKPTSSETIFVDDSCYQQQWKQPTSQRAEIYAAVLIMRMTTGPVSVGTHCATVSNRIQVLQAYCFRSDFLKMLRVSDVHCNCRSLLKSPCWAAYSVWLSWFRFPFALFQ